MRNLIVIDCRLLSLERSLRGSESITCCSDSRIVKTCHSRSGRIDGSIPWNGSWNKRRRTVYTFRTSSINNSERTSRILYHVVKIGGYSRRKGIFRCS